jgi:signal-transduction protein with cAMP-binding, CBS, and nucleotidyltransferase domain
MPDDTMTATVADLVTGRPVVVPAETSLRWVARQLGTGRATAAIVGHTRFVAGVISEHDLAEAVARGNDVDATPAEAAMTPYFASVEATASIEEAKEAIRRTGSHHLAVTSGPEVIGLLASEDVLRLVDEPG